MLFSAFLSMLIILGASTIAVFHHLNNANRENNICNFTMNSSAHLDSIHGDSQNNYDEQNICALLNKNKTYASSTKMHCCDSALMTHVNNASLTFEDELIRFFTDYKKCTLSQPGDDQKKSETFVDDRKNFSSEDFDNYELYDNNTDKITNVKGSLTMDLPDLRL